MNINNQPSFLFYSITFNLESEFNIDKKTYLSFISCIFITEIIVYCFLLYVRQNT